MIFESIKIQNLFSYHGEQVFDNLSSTSEKPVILITGRNGFGKTSFINSIKLLFLGTSPEMLSDVRGRKISAQNFLIGTDHSWQGVFNREARDENQREYGIQIVWQEENGRVTARRYWEYSGAEVVPHLHIKTDFSEDGLGIDGLIDDLEEAEEFLQRRLPREIVSLFFYDGEKVQALAEANEEGRMKQIEKLLGLAAVDTLDVFLKGVVSDWKRDGTQENEQAELEEIKARWSVKNAERSKLQVEEVETEAEIDNVDREIRKHERYIQSIRSLSDQKNVPLAKEKFENLTSEYEKLCQRIGATLPALSPVWGSPSIIHSISTQLENSSGSSAKQIADEMQNVFEVLPQRLFDEPTHPSPSLTAQQKNHYKSKLSAILKQFTDPPSSGFFSLNAKETLALQKKINYFLQADSERQRLADDLRDASRIRREWHQAKADIESVDEMSPDQKKMFRERQAALKELKEKRDDLLGSRGSVGEKISAVENEIVRLNNEIAQQETKRVKAGINSQNILRAEQARKVFDLYSHRLKEQRRKEIEETVNRCFMQLMSSHKLINRIEINENFALSYKDENGNDIGLANISAGMKQLAAQALLWALSEISGRNVPVIVDTPLARIDRQHQENLLRNYYPNAANQVIVLPTDAELDREKYNVLKPKIFKEFCLENSHGNRTLVKPNVKMYSSGAK